MVNQEFCMKDTQNKMLSTFFQEYNNNKKNYVTQKQLKEQKWLKSDSDGINRAKTINCSTYVCSMQLCKYLLKKSICSE